MTKKYGQAVVVFDGYKAGSSTKDCTYRRRFRLSGMEGDIQYVYEATY